MKTKSIRRTFRLYPEQDELLEKICKKEEVKPSEKLRQYMDKGIKKDKVIHTL